MRYKIFCSLKQQQNIKTIYVCTSDYINEFFLLHSLGLPATTQGKRELLKIASLAVSVGVQLLATIGETKRLEQI
jgi:CHAT domain-containing protein